MVVTSTRPTRKKVLLMGTCLCDAFFDDVAKATVEVLEHIGVEVIFSENQTCCGQPAFNFGDWNASRKVAIYTASVFAGDLPVIVPSGSCAAMNFHGNILQFEDCPDSLIGNVTLIPFGQSEQCCGFGGTFSVTFPHISGKMGKLKLDHILEQEPDLLISGDMFCLMHLTGLAINQGRKTPDPSAPRFPRC